VNSSIPQDLTNHSKATDSSPSINPISLCPVFAKAKKKRGPQNSLMPFLVCQGADCPCVRICVGQGKNKTNFHDCSTFRIICTFNCAPNKPKTMTGLQKTQGSKDRKKQRKNGKQRKKRPQKKTSKSKKQRKNKNRKPWPQLGIGKWPCVTRTNGWSWWTLLNEVTLGF